MIIASRSPEKGAAAAKEIAQEEGIKGVVTSIQLDVTDEASINAAAKQVEKDHGRLDVLINNAGLYTVTGSRRQQFEMTLQTNLIGVLLVTEAFEPLLFKSKRPYLIHVSSTIGSLSAMEDTVRSGSTVNKWDGAAYPVSKAALNMLTIQDFKRLSPRGVKVFTFCPGFVKSNLRGTRKEDIEAGGRAGDPDTSGRCILEIVRGDRDADNGKFLWKDGLRPW